MKNIIFSLLAILILPALALEQVGGSQIFIDPPEGLIPSNQFLGYVDEEYGTFVMVTEMPGSVDEAIRGLSSEQLSKQGGALLSTQDITLGHDKAKILKLTQDAYDINFTKWIVILGDSNKTIMVTANAQTNIGEEILDKLNRSILTTRWIRNSQNNTFDGLNYRVTETKTLKISNKMGSNLFLSKEKEFPIQNANTPYSIIVPSYSTNLNIDSKSNYAKIRLMKMEGFSDIKILHQKSIKVNGIEGSLIQSQAVNTRFGNKVYVHFAILFADESYYIIRSISNFEDRKLYEGEFNTILESFEINSSNKKN